MVQFSGEFLRGPEDASRVLLGLLRDIIRNVNDSSAWSRLFQFAPACFTQPGRGGKNRNLTNIVTKRIQSFASGAETGAEQEISRERSDRRRKALDHETEVARRATAKLGDGDVRGALRVLSAKETLAAMSSETTTCLLALHPPTPVDRRVTPPLSTATIQATTPDVRAAINSFPNGSASGPDGMRPQYLKDLIAGKTDSDPLLQAITDLVNIMLSG